LRNDAGMGKLACKDLTETHRTQRIALGVLTTLTFIVVAWMAAPMLVGLVLGTVLASRRACASGAPSRPR
jgi:hypothetical protein